jgi:hypothetical protein
MVEYLNRYAGKYAGIKVNTKIGIRDEVWNLILVTTGALGIRAYAVLKQ